MAADIAYQKINISGQRGKPELGLDGEMNLKLNDAFDVFKNVKGSPKYWQVARNELIAKVKQLGPFHVFYTFSCGEMRWPVVFISILEQKGKKSTFHLTGMVMTVKFMLKKITNSGSYGRMSMTLCHKANMSYSKIICF